VPIVLGKVNCDEETELAKQYEIKGYPTLKFFRNGYPIDHKGDRTHEALFTWLKKKSGAAVSEIGHIDDIQKCLEEADVCIVGHFTETESLLATVFNDVAASFDNYQFLLLTKPGAVDILEPDSITLFKNFDEKVQVYEGPSHASELGTFIRINSIPLVNVYEGDKSSSLFRSVVRQFVFVFYSQSAIDEEAFQKLWSTVENVATLYRGKFIFSFLDIELEDNQGLTSYFGVLRHETPIVRIFNLQERLPKKFKPLTEEISEKSLISTLDLMLEGKLPELLKSDPIPDGWDKQPVKQLVGFTFNKAVMETDKTVLVVFSTEGCGVCDELEPTIKKLGDTFKDSDTVVIAVIDGQSNDLENIRVTGYPTIKLFSKRGSVLVDFQGDRTLENLVKFINDHDDKNVREEL